MASVCSALTKSLDHLQGSWKRKFSLSVEGFAQAPAFQNLRQEDFDFAFSGTGCVHGRVFLILESKRSPRFEVTVHQLQTAAVGVEDAEVGLVSRIADLGVDVVSGVARVDVDIDDVEAVSSVLDLDCLGLA